LALSDPQRDNYTYKLKMILLISDSIRNKVISDSIRNKVISDSIRNKVISDSIRNKVISDSIRNKEQGTVMHETEFAVSFCSIWIILNYILDINRKTMYLHIK
jgi:hypothetical protein